MKCCPKCGGCLVLAFFDGKPENFYGEGFEPSYCPYCGMKCGHEEKVKP